MLCHLLLNSRQKAIKPALISYLGKLLGEDFVAKHLAFRARLAADKTFRQMSNTQHCLHPLLPNHVLFCSVI